MVLFLVTIAFQSPKLSDSEGQHIAETVRILQTLRNETHFDLFWMKVEAKVFDVDEVKLPRKRRLPRRLDDGIAEPECFSDSKQ